MIFNCTQDLIKTEKHVALNFDYFPPIYTIYLPNQQNESKICMTLKLETEQFCDLAAN